MIIGQIKDGIVLDHITAGRGAEVYQVLELNQLDCTVAMIERAPSPKMGSKDIIKIGQVLDIDFNVLGYIDPNITVNVVQNESIVRKIELVLPDKVENVIRCKNPRCITTTESYLNQIFRLVDRTRREYRCEYCDELHRGEMGV